MDIKSVIKDLGNQQHRLGLAIELLKKFQKLVDGSFTLEEDVVPKRKKKHWTQLPGAKAKLAKAHRKAKKTRENQ